MTNFQSRALGVLPTASNRIEAIYHARHTMSRESLIASVAELALSHERLRADFDGIEAMYNAINPRSE